ncbi:MAG: hypothetical protein NZ455_01810 [Bacteroidia bacterium]|nr:hypothetical protein [Bacteroidia bacterium]
MIFLGVSLPTSRCAHVGKVGVLRATLSLRCYALLTHPPHASRKPLLDALPYF